MDDEAASLAQPLQVDAHAFGASKQQAELLVEDEERDLLATPNRGLGELQHQQRLARPCGTQHQRTRPLVEATAKQRVQFGDAAGDGIGGEVGAVLRWDQARKHLHPTGADREIVIAAAIGLPAIFHHPKAPPLRAIVGRRVPRAE